MVGRAAEDRGTSADRRDPYPGGARTRRKPVAPPPVAAPGIADVPAGIIGVESFQFRRFTQRVDRRGGFANQGSLPVRSTRRETPHQHRKRQLRRLPPVQEWGAETYAAFRSVVSTAKANGASPPFGPRGRPVPAVSQAARERPRRGWVSNYDFLAGIIAR